MRLVRFIGLEEYENLISTGRVSAGNAKNVQPWSQNVLYFFRLQDDKKSYSINDFRPFVWLLRAYYNTSYFFAIEIEDDYARETYGWYPLAIFDNSYEYATHKFEKFEISDDNKSFDEDMIRVPEAKVPGYSLKQVKKLYRLTPSLHPQATEIPKVKQEALKMRRTIKLEASQLENLEVENSIIEKIKSKFGLAAALTQIENDLYQVSLENITALTELDLEDIAIFLEKLFSKVLKQKDIIVVRQNNTFYISIQPQAAGEHIPLYEVTQASAVTSADKRDYICALCGQKHKGWGNNGWPLVTGLDELVCDECNDEYVIPERLAQMFGKKTKSEAVDKQAIKQATSNLVLDTKFTWLFSVMDENARDIAEGIEELQDAIEILIENDAAFLVAFPYVDPKPEDESVELVFADTPGPVVIYNREEAVATNIKRPTKIKQAKGNE